MRACVLEKGGAWDCYLPLIEFTYNNSFHSSIGMAPFEACMVGHVGHLYVGMSPVRVLWLDRRLFNRLQKRLR